MSNTVSGNRSNPVATSSFSTTPSWFDLWKPSPTPVVTAAIYGRLFVDADGNNSEWNSSTLTWDDGRQGAEVRLLDNTGSVVATSTTNSTGKYKFTDVAAGEYRVKFMIPADEAFSQKDVGNWYTDSDVNQFGVTDVITVKAGKDIYHIDAGIVSSTSSVNVVTGTSGSDWMWGKQGDDLFMPNGGNDYIWTLNGFDVVEMHASSAKTTVFDFDVKKDRIDLSKLGIHNATELEYAIKMSDAGSRVTLSHDNSSVFLKNTDQKQLSLSNYIFAENSASLLTDGRIEDAISAWQGSDGQPVKMKSVRGNSVLALDATTGSDSVSQTVATEAGKHYTLSLDAMNKANNGRADGVIDVLWNGRVVAHFDAETEWTTMAVSVVGTGGMDTLTLREQGDDADRAGAFIDNVNLVEDHYGSPGDLEGAPSLQPVKLTPDGRVSDESNLAVSQPFFDRIDAMVQNSDFRDISGRFNNKNNPEFGAINQPFTRLGEADYGENGAPRGFVGGVQTLANERDISNAISDQDLDGDGLTERTYSINDSNLFLMSFGQFFDHGLDLMNTDNPDKISIALSPGDELYSFSNDGNPFNDTTEISITRATDATDPNTGNSFDVRTQFNTTAPFVEQSQTFGSSPAVSYYLRESARDASGALIRNEDGTIVKTASLLMGALDNTGRPGLPTYREILINNGVDPALIDAAVAANSFEMLSMAEGFVDHRSVPDPLTGLADSQPLLVDLRFDAVVERPHTFDLSSLLEHFVSGDGRANENMALTPLHIIFARDHEFWVEKLKEENGTNWTDDQYYSTAQAIVEAEYMHIVFNEYIDTLAGRVPGPHPHGFAGNQPRVDASISAEFAAAVYRVGHSMINETLPYETQDGTLQHISLVDAFLNPEKFAEVGADAMIKGETRVAHEEIDHMIVDAVRNQLLGRASDLAAINIARGRDFGLQTLNDLRDSLYNNGSAMKDRGSDVTRALERNSELKPYASWEEFAANMRDPSLVEDFKKVYASVDDVDLWIGGLAEKPRDVDNGQLGTTFTWVFWDQMDRIQDGDRFYYARFGDSAVLELLEKQTFADLIMRNTSIDFLPDNVFKTSLEVRMSDDEQSVRLSDQSELVIANDKDNVLRGKDGDDTFYAQDGNDSVYGGDGDDGIRGEGGNDFLKGGRGVDRLVGGLGDDTMYGGQDRDNLRGGEGNDLAYGGSGNDEVTGHEGNDTLYGQGGNDAIKGGGGNDLIFGGQGNDVIESSGGNDDVYTGSGNDIIVMSDDAGLATMHDFNVDNDRVDLRLFGIKQVDDVKTMTISEQSSGVMIENGERKVLLKGIQLGDLTMDNIKFTNDGRSLFFNGRMDEQNLVVSGKDIVTEDIFANSFREDGYTQASIANDRSIGWQNSSSDGSVEYVKLRANTAIEIDGSTDVDSIYQDVPTISGEVYTLKFDAQQGASSGAGDGTIEIVWNGALVATIETGAAWQTYSVEVTGTGGTDRVEFREEAADNNGAGPFIDNATLSPTDPTPERFVFQGDATDNNYSESIGFAEHIDGAAGYDTFNLPGAYSTDYSLTVDGATGETTVAFKGTTLATLSNIEEVAFTDVSFTVSDGVWV